MTPTGVLECHSDSGFSKEQDAGYGIRGANFLRHGKALKDGKPVAHLLDSQCRGHKHVTRCSFSSETRAAVVAADALMPMAMTLHEMTYGTLSPIAARSMRDNGECKITTILTVDSMSLWSAIAALVVRVPTEKNLAVHLFWLKELLDTRALSILRWCDTRDMTSDCHTKGSISRDAILLLMSGYFGFQHAVKDFSSRRPRAKYNPAENGQATGNHPYAHFPEPGSSKWKAFLLPLYRRYSQGNVQRLDEILVKYRGREAEVYEQFQKMHVGSSKGSLPNDQLDTSSCRICGQTGHWGNECPSRYPGRPSPVEITASATAASSSAGSTTAATSAVEERPEKKRPAADFRETAPWRNRRSAPATRQVATLVAEKVAEARQSKPPGMPSMMPPIHSSPIPANDTSTVIPDTRSILQRHMDSKKQAATSAVDEVAEARPVKPPGTRSRMPIPGLAAEEQPKAKVRPARKKRTATSAVEERPAKRQLRPTTKRHPRPPNWRSMARDGDEEWSEYSSTHWD